jgi:hypothetical protein
VIPHDATGQSAAVAVVMLAGGGTALALNGGGGGDGDDGDGDDTASSSAAADTDEWERVVPGGDCVYADGSEFAFWERRADLTKVVFYLDGGGICFDATTCAFTGTAGENESYNSSVVDENAAWQRRRHGALSYLAEHHPDATEVVVVGKASGSAAAPIYGGLAADLFPDAQVTVFGAQSGAFPDDPDFSANILG